MSGKRSSKKREQVREFIRLLKSGIIPENVHRNFLLRHLKYTLTPSEASKVIQAVDDNYFDYIAAYPIALEYGELFKEPGPYTNIPGKEISWVYRFLSDYSEEINQFVKLETEYSKYFLLGDYQKANEIIDKIEQDISLSMWGMQQRILVAEMERGFVGNKDLLSQFLTDEISSITTFVVNYTSIRAERNISSNQFEAFIDKYLEATGNDLEDYIYFKVDFFRKLKYDTPELILYIDGRCSVIDRYITFKQLGKINLCERQKNSLSPIWEQYLTKLSNVVDDPELNVINNLYGRFSAVSTNDGIFSSLLDAYTASDYNIVIAIAEQLIVKEPQSYHTILLYVKATINLGIIPSEFGNEGCVVDSVIKSVHKLLSKDSGFSQEAYSDVYKILHQLGNHPLAIGLFQTLNEEVPYRFSVYGQIDFFKLYIASSTMNNPAFYQFLGKKEQQEYLKNFQKNREDGATLKIIKRIANIPNLDELAQHSIRELKYQAVVLRNNGKLSEALSLYDYILNTDEYKAYENSAHLVLDMLIGKFNCLIQLGLLEESIELAVDSIISNGKYKERFFNPYLLELIMSTDNEKLQGNVCLPIYLAYYKANIQPYDLYVGYDNYMAILGYEKPRELIEAYESYDLRDLHFLSNVCTHEVLHSSPAFENQEELDLERLEICNFLVSKLEDSSDTESEISELLRKILIRKGIKQINYSKIYVDVPNLKDSLQKELRENFNRNIEIAALPLDQLNKILDSLGNMLVYYVDNQDENEEPSEDDLENVKLTSYNRYLHFREAFLKVRDRFIFDKDHGLDTYLSMRIRHGTLLGQIRSVFETNHLITVRNEIDNAYIPNDYWLQRMSELEAEHLEELNQSLSTFSKQIDEIAETLKLQTIQIITEKNKGTNGMFDFAYNEDQLLELFQLKFGSIKEYDTFIDQVILELWKRTELCLTSIKEYLKNELISKIEKVFDTLELEISKFTLPEGSNLSNVFQELGSTITNCRTAIVVEIGNISEWFNRSNKKFIDEFDFSVLAESSINTLQSIKPLFKDADIRKDIKCNLKFDGDLFPYFTDILYYLLDNAIKHSRLQSEDLWITITITQNEDKITFVVENNILNDREYIDVLTERIVATRNKIKDDVTYDRINKEGGTGFPKIKKTLKHDLKRKVNVVSLDLIEKENQWCFITTLTFETSGLKIIE